MTIRRRLRRLEQKSEPEERFAVCFGDEPIRFDGEEFTLETFKERYPAVRLIHVLYEDTPPGVPENRR